MRHDKSYRISFSSKDLDQLVSIRKAFSSNSLIVPDRGAFSLAMYSRNLFESLGKLGGISGKSTRLTFPQCPLRFLADFVRGYFDGDGSVHYIRYRHTKNGRYYINIRSNFTCGSESFLNSLKLVLSKQLGLFNRIIGQYGPHQFKLGYSQKDTLKLMKFMYYPGHSISLARKAAYLSKLQTLPYVNI